MSASGALVRLFELGERRLQIGALAFQMADLRRDLVGMQIELKIPPFMISVRLLRISRISVRVKPSRLPFRIICRRDRSPSE